MHWHRVEQGKEIVARCHWSVPRGGCQATGFGDWRVRLNHVQIILLLLEFLQTSKNQNKFFYYYYYFWNIWLYQRLTMACRSSAVGRAFRRSGECSRVEVERERSLADMDEDCIDLPNDSSESTDAVSSDASLKFISSIYLFGKQFSSFSRI